MSTLSPKKKKPSFRNLLNAFNDCVDINSMLAKNDKVLVALSGGADSIALLNLIMMVRNKYRLTIAIAHVNHGLHLQNIKAQNFCKQLARHLDLPFFSKKVSVKTYSKKNKLSIEESARLLRYEFLFKIAHDNEFQCLATGHNMSDLSETVLMRIIRGTGIFGIPSIAPISKIKGIKLIRPLLGLQKKDIKSTLRQNNIRFVSDPTNAHNDYLRNRLRNSLIPLMEKKYNRGIQQHLVGISTEAAVVNDFIDGYVARALKKRFTRTPSGGSLSIRLFSRIHPAIQKELIMRSISISYGTRRKILRRHVDLIMKMISSKSKNQKVSLPFAEVVKKNKEKMTINITNSRPLRGVFQ